jgi:hypothetical protein
VPDLLKRPLASPASRFLLGNFGLYGRVRPAGTAFSTAVPWWFADTEEVTGSNPVAPHHEKPQVRSGPRTRPLASVAWHPVVGQQTGSNREPTGRQTLATGAANAGTAGAEAACLGGRAAGVQQHGWGDSNSGPPPQAPPGNGCAGRLTCDSLLPVVTARARWTPHLRGPRVPTVYRGGPVRSRTPAALRSSATRDRSAGRARQGR